MPQIGDPGQREVNIVVTQRVLLRKEDEFEALLRETETMTIAADRGRLRYEWYRSEAPQTYVLLERWIDRAAVQAHLAAPHMVATRDKIQGLVPEAFMVVRLSKL